MNRVKRPSTGNTGFEHADKRSRIDQPSKVIFARNLPLDCMESELMAFCGAFDNVERILILKDKGQAFIQLQSVERAVMLVNFARGAPHTIRGKTIQFEFSSREEITTKPSTQRTRGSEAPGEPNKILIVTVSNMMYEVNVDVLYQVFSKHGIVCKIVTFWKNDAFRALIEMDSLESSIAAQQALNGRNIYTGCNSLQVLFSKHDELRVKFNNDKSRDYINTNLPTDSGILGAVRDYSILGNAPPPMYATHMDPYRPAHHFREDIPTYISAQPDYSRDIRALHGYGNQSSSPVIICSNLDEQRVSCDALFTLFGCYGDVQRVKILYKKRDTALIQFSNSHQAAIAHENLDGVSLYGRQLRINPSKHSSIAPVRAGSTGNDFEATHTKDYTNSKLHRFRSRDGKNYKNICPPSSLLHIYGIPEDIQSDQQRLIDLFSHQGSVSNFTFFEKNRKMALIQMASIDDALAALIALDNYDFNGRHIRVSFARSKIRKEPSPQGPQE